MSKNFRILYYKHSEENEIRSGVADMDDAIMYILKNKPMDYYYGVNIQEVDDAGEVVHPDNGGSFFMAAIREYYIYEAYGDDWTDEQIREQLIALRERRAS